MVKCTSIGSYFKRAILDARKPIVAVDGVQFSSDIFFCVIFILTYTFTVYRISKFLNM